MALEIGVTGGTEAASGGPFTAMGAGAGLLGLAGTYMTNEMNYKIAKEQMAFQERMSSTAIRRQMEDMRAGGLNPILAAKGGGASAPSGSAPVMQNPYEKAAATAMQYALYKEQLNQLRAQTEKTKSDEMKSLSEKALTDMNIKNVEKTNKIMDYQLDIIEAEASKADADNKFYSTPFGQKLRQGRLIMDSISPFFSSAKELVPGFNRSNRRGKK